MSERILCVEDLTVEYRGHSQTLAALKDVNFVLGRERLGIVGESGSGKSTLGRAIMKLLPSSAQISATTFQFRNIDLLQASEGEMCRIRGKQISMVLQDSKYSLNPAMTIGQQISESYRVHRPSSRAEAKDRALAMLSLVQIREPERVYNLYPHQISNGMGQRVMIAMMLIPEPEILIADEPTSALDVTIRAQLLELLDDLIVRQGMSLILISHDLNLVASFCDRVIIMYGGRIMETCLASELGNASHPYTRGLLGCRPLLAKAQDTLPTLSREAAWLEPQPPEIV